jgi:hypothetical protein
VNFVARWYGERTSQGVIGMRSDPAHQRESGGTIVSLPTIGYRHVNARIDIDGVAEAELQGCNGDPDQADNWDTLGSLSASGSIASNTPYRFHRVNVPAFTSGTVRADVEAVSD